MKFLQELFHGKGYIDGITIINLEGEILFTAKFNNKLGQDQGSEELVGKNFLDVYENLTPQTSTTITSPETWPVRISTWRTRPYPVSSLYTLILKLSNSPQRSLTIRFARSSWIRQFSTGTSRWVPSS